MQGGGKKDRMQVRREEGRKEGIKKEKHTTGSSSDDLITFLTHC